MQALLKVVKKYTPPFNPDIVSGRHIEQTLKELPDYLSELFKSLIKSKAAHIPLEYVGYRIQTPEEMVNSAFGNDRKATVDLAPSSFYNIEFIFRYNGTDIKLVRPLFYSDGQLINMTGTTYAVIPILSDTVITPSASSIFIRLLRDKITVTGMYRQFLRNGKAHAINIINTQLLKTNEQQIVDKLGKVVTPFALYPLGKYGIDNVMKTYFELDVSDFMITEKPVDEEEYVVFSSTKVKPPGLGRLSRRKTVNVYNVTTRQAIDQSSATFDYVGTDIKIAVKKKKLEIIENMCKLDMFENFIAGILYTFEIFTENSSQEVKNFFSTYRKNLNNEKLFWKIIIGKIAYKNSYSIDRIAADMHTHYTLIEGYLDVLSQSKLKEIGIEADNFYDLIMVVLSQYNIWLIDNKEYQNNLKNRYVDVSYYIGYDFLYAFNKAMLQLTKRGRNGVIPTINEVTKILSEELKKNTTEKLIKSPQQSLAIVLPDYAGDNSIFKVGTQIDDQSSGIGVRRAKSASFPSSAKLVTPQDYGFGSGWYVAKKKPSPRFKRNPYGQFDLKTGRIIFSSEDLQRFQKMTAVLNGRILEEDEELRHNVLHDNELPKENEEFLEETQEEYDTYSNESEIE